MQSINSKLKEYDREIACILYVYQAYADDNVEVETYASEELQMQLFGYSTTNFIKDFTIRESCDIVGTSLPHNELTITIGGERIKKQSIFSELSNRYVKGDYWTYKGQEIEYKMEIYIKNDSGYYEKVAHYLYFTYDNTQQNDDETLSVTFKSSLSQVEKEPLSHLTQVYGGNEYSYPYNIQIIYFDIEKNGFSKPRNIIYKDIKNQSIQLQPNTEYENYKKIRVINNQYTDYKGLLQDLRANCKDVVLFNDHNDDIVFSPRINYVMDEIPKYLQLSKPLIKREKITKAIINNKITSVEMGESELFTYNFEGFYTGDETTNAQETIIITSVDFNLYDVIYNDTYSTQFSGTNCSVRYSRANQSILLYDVYITDPKLPYSFNVQFNAQRKKVNTINEIYGTSSEKIIEITNDSNQVTYENYKQLVANPINYSVEVEIMGLPYIELGDCISIELDDDEIMVITVAEITTKYDGGLTQRIKGYTTDYNGLFPSNTLYPSDTLYPNRKK